MSVYLIFFRISYLHLWNREGVYYSFHLVTQMPLRTTRSPSTLIMLILNEPQRAGTHVPSLRWSSPIPTTLPYTLSAVRVPISIKEHNLISRLTQFQMHIIALSLKNVTGASPDSASYASYSPFKKATVDQRSKKNVPTSLCLSVCLKTQRVYYGTILSSKIFSTHHQPDYL